MKTRLLLLSLMILAKEAIFAAPPCSPLGNQTTYGSSNVWIGYVYQGKNFNTYKGYINEGVASSPNFDQNFGGDQVNYSTNGCPIYTDTFSVRYKLAQNFVDGDYVFTVGGDDGYRLSLDGGATWAVNKWNDQGYGTTTYSVHLTGSYNLVYEFYENFGQNRVSFNVVKTCTGSGNPSVYGTNNIWKGYVYSGMNFGSYKGDVAEGNSINPNFDESFGGANVSYSTSDCSVTTEQFSVRYRLQKSFTNGTYTFLIGGDDGYRLSFDGGATWAINRWNDQSYTTSSVTKVMNGSYSIVLEYYENSGANRISFNLSGGTILPLKLMSFAGQSASQHTNTITWKTSREINTNYFNVQRSENGIGFTNLAQIVSKSTNENNASELSYSFSDNTVETAISYYRLEMTDRDGHRTYSDGIKIANSTSLELRIFPTVISNGSFFVETSKPVRNAKLEIFDLSGKKMTQMNWEILNGKQSVNANSLGRLSTGTYVARLTSNSESLLNQLVIVQSR